MLWCWRKCGPVLLGTFRMCEGIRECCGVGGVASKESRQGHRAGAKRGCVNVVVLEVVDIGEAPTPGSPPAKGMGERCGLEGIDATLSVWGWREQVNLRGRGRLWGWRQCTMGATLWGWRRMRWIDTTGVGRDA